MTSSVNARVRAGEPDPLEPVDLAASAQELAERQPVAELDAVGVNVLAQQGDLDHAVVDASAWISARTSPGRRSFSLPRRLGTMQNVQVLLQPTEIDTQAEYGDSRLVGRTDGKTLERLEDLELGLARGPCPSSRVGSEPML